jgi:hypothetical protein
VIIQIQMKRIMVIMGMLVIVWIMTACVNTTSETKPTLIKNPDCKKLWQADTTAYSGDLDFQISLDKYTFTAGEYSLTNLEIKNSALFPIWVNRRLIINRPEFGDAGEVYFIIISPWGETAFLNAKVNASSPELSDFVLLNPGEVIQVKNEGILLYSYFSFYEPGGDDIDQHGTYCVWAIYHNQSNPGLIGFVWQGAIKSNYFEYQFIK